MDTGNNTGGFRSAQIGRRNRPQTAGRPARPQTAGRTQQGLASYEKIKIVQASLDSATEGGQSLSKFGFTGQTSKETLKESAGKQRPQSGHTSTVNKVSFYTAGTAVVGAQRAASNVKKYKVPSPPLKVKAKHQQPTAATTRL